MLWCSIEEKHISTLKRIEEKHTEASETVLGYFGFDRTVYGEAPKKNNKWWYGFMNGRALYLEKERS